MRCFKPLILIGLSVILLLPVSAIFSQEGGVSDARYAQLERGINLAFWFWYASDNLTEVENYYTPADLTLLHDLGFTFVRLPIDWQFVYDASSPDLLNAERMPIVDRALDEILAADLAVIVDLHSLTLDQANNSLYSGALESDPQVVVEFVAFWRSFATHLSVRDPEKVFFAPMNEPVFEADPSAWEAVQIQLVAAVREGAPQHTIIATSALWSSRETLVNLHPLNDPNVVYDFHFYDPFLFTHQGATWTWDAVIPMRLVPYPADPQNVQPAIEQLSDPELQGYLRDYGDQYFNQSALDNMIAPVLAWADEHGVRIICGEFGVLKDYADPLDRAHWIYDARTIFEKYGIGWAMWEYDGNFGLVSRVGGSIKVDPPIVEALGLRIPE